MGYRPNQTGGAPNVQAASGTTAPSTNSTGQGPAAQQQRNNERRKDNPNGKMTHGEVESPASTAASHERSKSP